MENKRKKVSLLALHLDYGGIERAIVTLANGLCKDYDVEIISIYKLSSEPAFLIDKKVKITYLIESDLPKRVATYKLLLKKGRIIKLLGAIGHDYIIKGKFIALFKDGIQGIGMYRKRRMVMESSVKNCDSDVIISTRDFLNEILAKCGRIDCLKIGWEHNHHNNDQSYINKVVSSSKNLDYLVLVSQELTSFYQEQMTNINSRCQVLYIPNMIPDIPTKSADLTSKHFISVGRLSKEKGYLDLLKMYKQLLAYDNSWKLDIIGDGDERESLEKYLEQNNLTNYVTLHGFKDQKYIKQKMLKSSIYLMSSYTESFGLVLLEAMSNGLPCVAFTSARGALEIIEDNVTGYLITNRDFQMYIDKVKLLMTDDKQRIKMGQNGRRAVRQYTEPIVLKKWYELLERKIK